MPYPLGHAGCQTAKKVTTSAGFEPARAKPSRFLIYRLNHSATVSKCSSKNLPEGFEPPSSGLEPDVLTTTLWEVGCTCTAPVLLTVGFCGLAFVNSPR